MGLGPYHVLAAVKLWRYNYASVLIILVLDRGNYLKAPPKFQTLKDMMSYPGVCVTKASTNSTVFYISKNHFQLSDLYRFPMVMWVLYHPTSSSTT